MRLPPWGQRSPQPHGQPKLLFAQSVSIALSLLRRRALFIFIFFPERRGSYRSMPPCIPQIARFQVHGCWIGARRTFHRPISTDYTKTVEAIFRELELTVSER
jgi:hypothetical protein